MLRPCLVHNDLTHSFNSDHGPNHLCSHLLLWSQPQLVSRSCMRSHPPSPAIVSRHMFFSMVLVLCYHHWQSVYIQSVPLTPARHSPSPHLCIHPPLLSLLQRAFLQLYRSSSPTSIKDLRAPLSTNQVVIRAAKIRGLINKGLSLLAGGSQCLKRWHQSAFWEHQVDARTPGVPWNGKQKQGLALANNVHIGCLLAIFFPWDCPTYFVFYFCLITKLSSLSSLIRSAWTQKPSFHRLNRRLSSCDEGRLV